MQKLLPILFTLFFIFKSEAQTRYALHQTDFKNETEGWTSHLMGGDMTMSNVWKYSTSFRPNATGAGSDSKAWFTKLSNNSISSLYFTEKFHLESPTLNLKRFNSNETVLYRVNVGGSAVADSLTDWSEDTYSNPSQYLKSTGNTIAHEEENLSLEMNTIGLRDHIFNSYREGIQTALRYQFPVARGRYRVNLFFGAYTSATEQLGKNFNVKMENYSIWPDYDKDAITENSTALKTFKINVSDGYLNIDILPGTSNPQLSGIEISSLILNSDEEVLTEEKPEARYIVSPNPIIGTSFQVHFLEGAEDKIKLEVIGLDGTIFLSQEVTSEARPKKIDLAKAGLQTGIYIVKLQTKKVSQYTRLLKY